MATRSSAIGSRSARPKTTRVALTPSHPAVLLGLVIAVLVLLGTVMILSASSVSSFAASGSSFVYFERQLIWVAIGATAFFVALRIDYRRLRRVGVLLYGLSLALMVLVLIPGIGSNVNGSSRWIDLGPLSFQPSELAKLGLILVIADVMARKKERLLREFSHTALPVIPLLGAGVLLVMLQPDLGTTMLLGFIALGMLFVAGVPMTYLFGLGLTGGALALAAALSAEYRRERVLAFLDPWKDPLNTGYHTVQSLIALGSGGWFGVGLGASRQKWLYVPNAHTDFIFAILGEEMGLLGSLVVVALFTFFVYLGVRIARLARDRYGMLVAAGITIWIATQAFVNMGAVTGSLPITGVPLPLVSFGGSSFVVTMAGLGILTNIALQGRRRVQSEAAS